MTITRGHGKEVDAMIEQAYRRGYDQGFNEALNHPNADRKKVHEWRYARKNRDEFIPPPYSGIGEST